MTGATLRCRRGRRVLIIIENVSLARDHRARKQAATLASNGYQVSVICRRDPRNHRRDLDGVRIYEYWDPGERTGVVGFLWEYGFSLLAAFALCCRVAIERGFDVIQIGSPPDAQFVVALPFRAFGCTVIVDQRDLSPEVYRDRYGKDHGVLWSLLGRLERMSWRAADHIITVNHSLAETIVERGGVPRGSVTVVGNGPHRDRAGICRHELKCGKPFLVIWLGLMGPQDHVELALDAARHLLCDLGRRDCQFVFIGDGEELSALRRRSRELGVEDSVTFTGWLDERDCLDYLATADLALDSNLQEEVTPVKGLEYLSSGVPMVAFDLRETRRMADGAAVYASVGQSVALARGIVELLDDEHRRAEMGAIGRKRIEDALAWEHQAVRYLEVCAREDHHG